MAGQVYCIGELLIDFICTDGTGDLSRGEHFLKKAGGAPANVAATLSRLGTPAWFAGKVGADPFGDFLERTLKDYGVETSQLIRDPHHGTTLAFVSLTPDGERDFLFQRGADAWLTEAELDESVPAACDLVHFGSATALLGGPTRTTYLNLLKRCKGTRFVSFDPNWRSDLWRGREADFIREMLDLLPEVDLLKVSDSELELLCGPMNREEAVRSLHERGVGIIAVTLGSAGTYLSNGQQSATVSSIPVQTVDSTGAGDAFVGAFLSKVAALEDRTNLRSDFDKLVEITKFANRIGALVCTRMGAMEAIPAKAKAESIDVTSFS